MAIDVYLKLDDVQGESADDGHKDWIECQSVHWGVYQPKSASSSSNGGHTAERCAMADVTIHRRSDLATPKLLQLCAQGKTIPKGKLEFMRADGSGKPVRYFEIELENVLIGTCTPGVEEGDTLTETIALKFSQVKWKYTQQKVSGGTSGNTSGGWSLATNKIV